MRYLLYSGICALISFIFFIIKERACLNKAEETTCDVIIMLFVIASVVFGVMFDIMVYSKLGLTW